MRTAYADCRHPESVAQLFQGLSTQANQPGDPQAEGLELVLLFVSPQGNIAQIAAQAQALFSPVPFLPPSLRGNS